MTGIGKSILLPWRRGFRWGIWLLAATLAAGSAGAAEPFAVPTFHALGVYWSPDGGTTGSAVNVAYRREGADEWRDALPLRYNPITGAKECRADYRGSIVNLTPDTHYEIRLRLAGTSATATLTAATWSENYPIGITTKVASQNTPLQITESGTPTAWRVYDGTGATIDVKRSANNCIVVNASYVILRGFTLRGAGLDAPPTGRYQGAIQIEKGHDIVIERCDIADWGRPAAKPIMADNGRDRDSGVCCNNPDVTRVVIQRCRIHNPHYDTNHWYEPVKNTHPSGPQCISFNESAGNHVIRYNEFFSDAEHMFNDILGGGENASHRGFPGPDTDIYCNTLSHCWDDAIEVEGSDCNVRVWNNYVSESMTGLGNAPVTIGPLYFWRNVVSRTRWYPGSPAGSFVKMGFATGEEWMTGWIYLFHNTVFQEGAEGCAQGIGGKSRVMRHTVTRNNIIQLLDPAKGGSISSTLHSQDNDFDDDLYNGSVPRGHEAHGIKGEPRYAAGAGFDGKGMKGNFQLEAGSPGRDAGEVIPNFSDGWTGAAPDMGAQENGWSPMQFGVKAEFQPGGMP